MFFYGNNYMHNPESTRLFPYILHKIEPKLFSFKRSKFNVEKYKDSTSRVCLWRSLKIPAVYTLETSLCGGSMKSQMPHFTIQNLMKIGQKFCVALLLYQDIKKSADEYDR